MKAAVKVPVMSARRRAIGQLLVMSACVFVLLRFDDLLLTLVGAVLTVLVLAELLHTSRVSLALRCVRVSVGLCAYFLPLPALMVWAMSGLIYLSGRARPVWRLWSMALLVGLPLSELVWLRAGWSGDLLLVLLLATVWTTNTLARWLAARQRVDYRALPLLVGGLLWVIGSHGWLNNGYLSVAGFLCLPLAALAGEQLSAVLKRRAGVRVWGNRLGELGGVLDQLAGFLAAGQMLAILVFVFGEVGR